MSSDLPEGALPIILGGEHTLTLASVRAFTKKYPDLVVLQIDAHLDLIDEYAGLKLSHATVMRRVAEFLGWDSILQLGVRSGTRAEYENSDNCIFSTPALSLANHIWDEIKGRPVYLSIDIDVLDPAFAPGTGCPEPAGAFSKELFNFLHSLKGTKIAAVDLVEVCPCLDNSDITSITAAKIVRELILLFAP